MHMFVAHMLIRMCMYVYMYVYLHVNIHSLLKLTLQCSQDSPVAEKGDMLSGKTEGFVTPLTTVSGASNTKWQSPQFWR